MGSLFNALMYLSSHAQCLKIIDYVGEHIDELLPEPDLMTVSFVMGGLKRHPRNLSID
jgi:hypothetical protein